MAAKKQAVKSAVQASPWTILTGAVGSWAAVKYGVDPTLTGALLALAGQVFGQVVQQRAAPK